MAVLFPIKLVLLPEMGIETMKYNVVAAQYGAWQGRKGSSFGMSSMPATLSKIGDDICLYMTRILIFNLLSG